MARAFREVLKFSDDGGGQVVLETGVLVGRGLEGVGARASSGLADSGHWNVDVVGGFQLPPA